MNTQLVNQAKELIHLHRTLNGLKTKEQSLRQEIIVQLDGVKVIETTIGRIEKRERRKFAESPVAKKSLAELRSQLKVLGEIAEAGRVEYLVIQADKNKTTLREGV